MSIKEERRWQLCFELEPGGDINERTHQQPQSTKSVYASLLQHMHQRSYTPPFQPTSYF